LRGLGGRIFEKKLVHWYRLAHGGRNDWDTASWKKEEKKSFWEDSMREGRKKIKIASRRLDAYQKDTVGGTLEHTKRSRTLVSGKGKTGGGGTERKNAKKKRLALKYA